MTSYLIFLACIIKSSIEGSDASVRALKVQIIIIEIPGMAKFNYLLNALKGEARECIKKFQVT
ncbi:hypothetical protein ANCDUO_15193 [Ancylostoma duodenale]|uniref:Uncharacterized protein n=1 Tax=Ancylostoma duodenale TaxID=51022 RepID=A0A0C2G137_9BILA|nr:hypothetical protein ANCDUO_15193 [Ancylostoma duodenale]